MKTDDFPCLSASSIGEPDLMLQKMVDYLSSSRHQCQEEDVVMLKTKDNYMSSTTTNSQIAMMTACEEEYVVMPPQPRLDWRLHKAGSRDVIQNNIIRKH